MLWVLYGRPITPDNIRTHMLSGVIGCYWAGVDCARSCPRPIRAAALAARPALTRLRALAEELQVDDPARAEAAAFAARLLKGDDG